VIELNLEQQFTSFIQKENLWDSSDSVLIALSGGVDSVVLTHLMTQLPKRIRPQLNLVYINHQLREESITEENYIRNFSQKKNIPLFTFVWNKTLHPEKDLENEARKMRYDYFNRVMEENNIPILITAHHLGDQAETVLMKLIRGGLIENKKGIELKSSFREKQLLRPLLPFSKQELYEYASENKLTYFEDQTNHTDLYERNRIRRNIIPYLKKENPKIQEHLYDFSKELDDLIDVAAPLIEKKKEELITKENNKWKLTLKEFHKEKRSMRYFILVEILKDVYKEEQAFNKHYVELLLDWLETSYPNSSYQLSEGWVVQRRYQEVIFKEKTNESSLDHQAFTLDKNDWTQLSETERIGFFTTDKEIGDSDLVIYCYPEEISLPVTIRHRKNGDKMTLKGTDGSKKIKDIFIDQKVSLQNRDKAWVLEDSKGQILWLVGYKESQLSKYAITDRINYIFIYQSMND